MEIIIKDNAKQNEKVFYQYKIRVELPLQTSVFDDPMEINLTPRERKNLAVKRIFNWIKESDNYFDFRKSNGEFSIIKFQTLSDEILIFKLAKEKDVQLTAKAETFVEKKENDYPYSLVIFDYTSQVLYVEKNYRVFQFPNAMIKVLESMLFAINQNIPENQSMKFFINMITDSKEFIDCYNTFDLVSRVSLTLDSPNSFLGSKKADDFLNEVQKETQAKKTTMEIKNEEGLAGLGILSFFKDLFTYITNGGGFWSVSGKPKGKDKTITKTSKTKIKTLNINFNISIDQKTIQNGNEIVNIISKENRFNEDEEA